MTMKSLRHEFADTMLALGQQDERLVVMVGDISHGILQPFAKAFPKRYYNVGICEPTIVGMAAGLSMAGLIPVAHTIAPFLIERSFEQLKLDFGYQKLGGNFISVGGAFDYSQLGCSHHCYTDISLLGHLPNSQIYTPGSAEEFHRLFCETYNNGCLNYFKLTEYPHGLSLPEITAGKGVRIREGSDLTMVAVGPQLKQCNDAAVILESKHNVSVDLIYYHTVKPFDEDLLVGSIEQTLNALVCEQLSSSDGVFNKVLRAWASRAKATIQQCAIPDFVRDYGGYEELLASAHLDSESIVQKSLSLLS